MSRANHFDSRSPSTGLWSMSLGSGLRVATWMRPPDTSSGAVTSAASRLAVASPQARALPGRAAAVRTPAARPTEVSSAEETTTLSPVSRAMRRARSGPPSGAILMTATWAPLIRAAATGLGALLMDSSAAMGTSMRRCSS